jgi:hypothetical protein
MGFGARTPAPRRVRRELEGVLRRDPGNVEAAVLAAKAAVGLARREPGNEPAEAEEPEPAPAPAEALANAGSGSALADAGPERTARRRARLREPGSARPPYYLWAGGALLALFVLAAGAVAVGIAVKNARARVSKEEAARVWRDFLSRQLEAARQGRMVQTQGLMDEAARAHGFNDWAEFCMLAAKSLGAEGRTEVVKDAMNWYQDEVQQWALEDLRKANDGHSG